MPRKQFTDKQRLAILAEQDTGKLVDQICRDHQISQACFYRWKKNFAIEQDDDKRRIRELEKENERLKKMYAELSLDHGIMSDGYAMLKKWQAQDSKKN